VVSPAALRPRTAGELGGLIVAGGAPVALQRDVVIKLAARHRLPALYSDHALVTDGGLMASPPGRAKLSTKPEPTGSLVAIPRPN
jgi:hypothetical protein